MLYAMMLKDIQGDATAFFYVYEYIAYGVLHERYRESVQDNK